MLDKRLLLNFLKNNWFFLGTFIILALILRLIGIDKPSGLWHDEINTYNLCSLPVTDVFFRSFPRPLYHLILHYWIVLFGDEDIILRLLSVIFGVINIPVMYFAGKELEKYFNKENIIKFSLIGTSAALLVAVNAFSIYYSQEVRQYSFLALISTISAWFTIRVLNKPCKLNYILFFMINAAFLLTHFISALIVIPEVIFICIYLFFYNKNQFRQLFKIISGFLIFLGIIFILLINSFISQVIHSEARIINNYSEVNYFDFQVIFVLLQNYFSPVVVGIYNNPANYLLTLLSDITLGKIIFIFIPVILSLWLIIKAVIKEKNCLNPIYALLIPPLCFLIIVFTLSFLKTYVIIPRYTLICLPFFILAISKGLYSFKNKRTAYFIFSVLILINLSYIIFYPNSAPKLNRVDGQKAIANLFTDIHLKENDIVIFPRIKNTIDKYNKSEFKKYSMHGDFLYRDTIYSLIGKNAASTISMSNSSELLKNYLLLEEYPPEFENYVKEKFFDSLPESGYFIIAHNQNICYYTPELLKKVLNNKELYEKNSLQFMLFSKITLDLYKVSQKHLVLKQVKQNSPWTIFIFQKKGFKQTHQ